MASSINASLTAGLVQTADTSGIINLQSGGTTIVAVTSTGAAVTGTLSSTGNTTLGDASTDTLNVGNGDLIKDASGNVGVGVTPKTWSQGKAIELGISGVGLWQIDSGSFATVQNTYYNTGWKYASTAPATYYVQSSGQHQWFNAPSGTINTTATFTQAMTLDASNGLYLGTATTGLFSVSNYSASTQTTNLSKNPSDQGFNIGTRNGVAGSSSGTEIARLCWGYGGTDSAWISGERNGGTGANRVNVVCSSAGVYLASAGTAWASLSDERHKTNLSPITDASAKLNTLRTVTGRYIEDEESVSRAFLIAQEVKVILPEAVDTQENEEGTLGLRYTDLIPLLIAGFKEQQALITSLTARLDEQQVQISVLQGAK